MNKVLEKILFLSYESIKTKFIVEVKNGCTVNFPNVKVVSMSEDNKILKVDSVEDDGKTVSRYFNVDHLIDFFFEFTENKEESE